MTRRTDAPKQGCQQLIEGYKSMAENTCRRIGNFDLQVKRRRRNEKNKPPSCTQKGDPHHSILLIQKQAHASGQGAPGTS